MVSAIPGVELPADVDFDSWGENADPGDLLTPQGPPPERSVAEIIANTRVDPVWFIERILGEHLWTKQRAITRAIFKHRRVAVKACHSSGKTHVSAGIIHAFFNAYPGCKILTTAPTGTQVEGQLWPEIRILGRKLPKGWGVNIYAGAPRMWAADDWWAIGRSTNEATRFQGYHAPKMLFVVDEAVGVDGAIFEAIEGNRAGGDVHLLLLGNPTVPGGPFYDAFSNPYDAEANPTGWVNFTISAFDTPNFTGLGIPSKPDASEGHLEPLLALTIDDLYANPLPYLTTRFWVHEKYHEWGPDSPLWQGRVLGIFPEQASDSLFPLSYLEGAAKQEPKAGPQEPFDLGIDVAGPGEDETVGYARCGGDILDGKPSIWAQADPREAACQWVQGMMQRAAGQGRVVRRVNVDAVGIGYNFALHVQDFVRSLPGVEKTDSRVKLVNVGDASLTDDKLNRKAEEYWGLRLRMQRREVTNLKDATTYTQLAGMRYKQLETGKIQIEPKSEARKRGMKSPDRAEALMLAFASDRTPGMLAWAEGRVGGMVEGRREIIEATIATAKEKGGNMSMAEALRLVLAKEAKGEV